MRADLTFTDAALEEEFSALQASRSRQLGKQVRRKPLPHGMAQATAAGPRFRSLPTRPAAHPSPCRPPSPAPVPPQPCRRVGRGPAEGASVAGVGAGGRGGARAAPPRRHTPAVTQALHKVSLRALGSQGPCLRHLCRAGGGKARRWRRRGLHTRPLATPATPALPPRPAHVQVAPAAQGCRQPAAAVSGVLHPPAHLVSCMGSARRPTPIPAPSATPCSALPPPPPP